MSFFRRGNDNSKYSSIYDSKYKAEKLAMRSTSSLDVSTSVSPVDAIDNQAFGSALEENKQSSEQLVASISFVQERIATLLDAHDRSLNEVGSLRAESARLGSLLDYESNTRKKLDHDNLRLAGENKEIRTDNAQLRVEVDALRHELVKLQAVHTVTTEEYSIIESRLMDAERELSDRGGQFEEATALVKRTQGEIEARNRDLATLREKLDVETTAHQLLNETSRRESAAQAREINRLNEEKSELKSSLTQQVSLVRSLQAGTTGYRQEISVLEDKNRHLEEELEGLQNSTTLQMAHMNTRQEALNSKAELAEKLLATANGRNRMTDEELRTTRAELKRLKSELQSATTRAERLTEELSRARSTGSESEATRRELAAQNSELTVKFREAEGLRAQRERDWEEARQDLETRAHADRHEISQMRTSLEIAKSEIRQLRTDRAILTGQLEAARGERTGSAGTQSFRQDDELEQSLQAARSGAQPLIEISEKSLRARAGTEGSAGIGDRLQTMDVSELPPAE